jgi:hypothetical protein
MDLDSLKIKLSDRGKVVKFSLSNRKIDNLSSSDMLKRYIVIEDGESQYIFTPACEVVELNLQLKESENSKFKILSKKAGTTEELKARDCVLEFLDVEIWPNGAFAYDGRVYNKGIFYGDKTSVSIGYQETEGEDIFSQNIFDEDVDAREYKNIKEPPNPFDPRIETYYSQINWIVFRISCS